MQIEAYPFGIFRVLKIKDKLVISQLQELRLLIQGYINQGEVHMAIHFTDASYLYSGAIAVLVSCYKMVKDAGGDLCLLEPKPELADLLCQMGIDSIFSIYASQDDLPTDSRQVE